LLIVCCHVLQEDADHLTHLLNAMGVEAYRGATQLNIVEPLNGNPDPLLNSNDDSRSIVHHRSGQAENAHHDQLSIPQQVQQDSRVFLPGNAHENVESHHERTTCTVSESIDSGSSVFSSSGQNQAPRLPDSVKLTREHVHTKVVGDQSSDLSSLPALNNHEQNQVLSKNMPVDSDTSRANDAQDSCYLPRTKRPNRQRSWDRDESSVPAVNQSYPHEAKYLLDHVVYLPVNKLVPFHHLNRMLRTIHAAVSLNKKPNRHKVQAVSKL
jgi:hypothetical protein